MEQVLGDGVQEVRASQRLTDSASCLVLNEQDMALHLRRMLEQAGQELPDSKPVLEVNLSHPLLARLESSGSLSGRASILVANKTDLVRFVSLFVGLVVLFVGPCVHSQRQQN